jgi:hypothetical protein
VPGRHSQQLILLHQHAARGEARLAGAAGGPRAEHHVDLAAPEGTEAAHAELVLVGLDLAVGILGPEDLGHLQDELAGGGPDEPDPQGPLDTAGGGRRPVDGVVDLLVGGPQLVAQAATDRGQLHPAAGALEQRGADAPLQLLNRLADPGRGHVQPLGRPAEVQLVGEHQEDLDIPLLHRHSVCPLTPGLTIVAHSAVVRHCRHADR